MERKLVTLKMVDAITPIEGADKIECAHIGGWAVVVGKGEFSVGQTVFYFEVDSLLPLENKVFAFLEPRGVTTQNGIKYHRLKTAKLRGQISQGLIMPFEIINEIETDPGKQIELCKQIDDDYGGDYSSIFKVVKYDPPMPAELSGKAVPFPAWINKTDEERVQNLDKNVQEIIFKDRENFVATEKIDGTSCTIWAKMTRVEKDCPEMNLETAQGTFRFEYGVCSRNLGIVEDDTNTLWKLARTPFIHYVHGDTTIQSPLDYLKLLCQAYFYWAIGGANEVSYILQGEVFGEGIQSNPLKVKGQHIKFFNLYENGELVPLDKLKSEFQEITQNWVPIHDLTLPETLEEAITQPDGIKSLISPEKVQIEGIVWRHKSKAYLEGTSKIDLSKVPEEKREMVASSLKCNNVRASFKCISNKYLLKHDG